MNKKNVGYRIMQAAVSLMVLGGIGDILYSFTVETIIPAHLAYLNIASTDVSVQLRNLDLGFMRGIGGFIIAIGIGGLALLHIGVKNNDKLIIGVLIMMITIGEGNNTLQMILLDSPFFLIPLIYLILFWIGGLLWFLGRRANKSEVLNL